MALPLAPLVGGARIPPPSALRSLAPPPGVRALPPSRRFSDAATMRNAFRAAVRAVENAATSPAAAEQVAYATEEPDAVREAALQGADAMYYAAEHASTAAVAAAAAAAAGAAVAAAADGPADAADGRGVDLGGNAPVPAKSGYETIDEVDHGEAAAGGAERVPRVPRLAEGGAAYPAGGSPPPSPATRAASELPPAGANEPSPLPFSAAGAAGAEPGLPLSAAGAAESEPGLPLSAAGTAGAERFLAPGSLAPLLETVPPEASAPAAPSAASPAPLPLSPDTPTRFLEMARAQAQARPSPAVGVILSDVPLRASPPGAGGPGAGAGLAAALAPASPPAAPPSEEPDFSAPSARGVVVVSGGDPGPAEGTVVGGSLRDTIGTVASILERQGLDAARGGAKGEPETSGAAEGGGGPGAPTRPVLGAGGGVEALARPASPGAPRPRANDATAEDFPRASGGSLAMTTVDEEEGPLEAHPPALVASLGDDVIGDVIDDEDDEDDPTVLALRGADSMYY